MRALVALLVAAARDAAAPQIRWSWSTVQTFAHCSNTTATDSYPFEPDMAAYFGSLPFVVIEKTQGAATPPATAEAELKIGAAARQIMALNSTAHVMAYYQTDKARRWYASGEWFSQRPEYLLRNSSGRLCAFPSSGPAGAVLPDYVYDYSQPAARAHWADSLANMTAAGDIAGFFIDGPSNVDGWR